MAESKHCPDLMKEYNEKLLYNLIRTKGPISRADLAKLTEMSPASVGRITSRFLEAGLSREVGMVEGRVGRKATLLDNIPERILAIGVHINVHLICVGLVNIRGDILHRVTRENRADNTTEQMLTLIKNAIDEIMNGINDDLKKRIIGIGVSMCGPVEWPEGVVVSSPQFHWGIIHFPLCLLLQNSYDFEVLVDNDTKSAAKAEQLFGDTDSYDSFVVVYLGSGIGSTLSINGRIIRGGNNRAGEIGHLVVAPNEILCDCGRRGCLQSTACISGIERTTGKKLEEVVELAEGGNPEYVSVLDKTATYLSQWIANLSVIYDPNKIIIYGEMLDIWPDLYEKIRERYRLFMWIPEDSGGLVRKSYIKSDDIPYLAGAANVFHRFVKTDVSILNE